MNRMSPLIATIIVLNCAPPVESDVIKYTNKAQWQTLADEYTTITFMDLAVPPREFVTDQYSYLGVTFVDGNDVAYMSNSLVNDYMGLYGNLPGDSITIQFAAPVLAFAIEHPGTEAFKLYSGANMIFDTGLMGSGGTGFFSGVISTTPFDKVVIDDPFAITLIDDLHFGPPIPAPETLGVVVMLAALGIRRRRRA